MKTPARNQSGFTLIELMIAIAILAIGLLATASMMGVAMNSDKIANKVTIATAIGQEVLEDLLGRRRNDPVVDTAGTVAVNMLQMPAAFVIMDGPVGSTVYLTPNEMGHYQVQYTITRDAPVLKVNRIVVTVTYSRTSGEGMQLGAANKVVVITGYKRVWRAT